MAFAALFLTERLWSGSVFRRYAVHAVNKQIPHRHLPGDQLQPELFLYRREDVGGRGSCVIVGARSQIEVVVASQAG